MRVRQRARQRNVELPLIVSDRADWDELTQTILDVAPREVWITNREDAPMHWCATPQIKARELNLVGYEDEDDWGEARDGRFVTWDLPGRACDRPVCAMSGRSATSAMHA